jgi:hypothetical protein
MTLAGKCRDFTVAAYSLGHAIDLTETVDDRLAQATYRCTWRRSGPLGSGETRTLTVDSYYLTHDAHVFDDVLLRRLVEPLVGADILAQVHKAALHVQSHMRNRQVPVEFVGGARDGDVWAVEPDMYGTPELDPILLPELLPAVTAWTTVPSVLEVSPRPLPYRRGTLDADRGVWRYIYAG